MSGYSRTEVLRLMGSLREQNLVRLEGRGRAAHYVPGPRLPKARGSGRGRPA